MCHFLWIHTFAAIWHEFAWMLVASGSHFRRVNCNGHVEVCIAKSDFPWSLWVHPLAELHCEPISTLLLLQEGLWWHGLEAAFCTLGIVEERSAWPKSYSDLQSVMAIAGSSLKVAVAKVSGSFFKVSVGFFQLVCGSRIQLQNKRNQESWSSVVFNDVVSADRVLVTTLCIFLHPQLIGFTTQTGFLPMSSCVVMIIVPVWDSGCFFDAKDASENARKRILSMGIGWILMEVSLCLLASCKVLFAWMRVSIVALLISLCKKLKRLAKSGLVFTDAYWRDPMSARRSWRSRSVTGNSSWAFRSGWMWIGLILVMYFSCDMTMVWSFCWFISIPVNTKFCDFFAPKGNFFSSSWIAFWKYSSPPQSPSSTCTPKIPEGPLEWLW